MSDKNKDIEENEIDLLELGRKLWDNKKFIIKCSAVGAIIGIVIAFSIPKEYTTTVILTAEANKSAGGSMGALASMAGINLGGNAKNDVFAPELYPIVLNSTPFVQGLLNVNVFDPKQDINTTLYNYVRKNQKTAWWSYVLTIPGIALSTFKSEEAAYFDSTVDNKLLISREEMSVIGFIRNSYSINTDKKTGITTLEITVQSPKISAYLADTLTAYLQTYVIEQRTKKAKTDLANSENLYKKARDNYYKAQQDLASFADANKNITLAKYKINEDRLQSESNLAYSVYNQMAQQVQMNKIKIQDNTPVFTIIQPAIEPLLPEKPKKKVIIVALTFLSLVGSCSWILGKDIFQQLQNNK